jgi:predicted RNase H-like HicB family nuclease
MAKTSKRYTVRYELDESGAWNAQLKQLPGVITHARSIAQARRYIREALALWLDDDVAAENAELVDDVRIETIGGTHVVSLLSKVQKERRDLEALRAAVTKNTEHAAKQLAKAGLSVRDVGELLGLSHQRVQQLLASKTA